MASPLLIAWGLCADRDRLLVRLLRCAKSDRTPYLRNSSSRAMRRPSSAISVSMMGLPPVPKTIAEPAPQPMASRLEYLATRDKSKNLLVLPGEPGPRNNLPHPHPPPRHPDPCLRPHTSGSRWRRRRIVIVMGNYPRGPYSGRSSLLPRTPTRPKRPVRRGCWMECRWKCRRRGYARISSLCCKWVNDAGAEALLMESSGSRRIADTLRRGVRSAGRGSAITRRTVASGPITR